MNFISKIENKLRINYPNLWSSHLFPFAFYACILYLIIIVSTYLFFSIIPYSELSTMSSWALYKLKFSNSELGQSINVFSYIFATILALIWYITYQKQNPLKVFYPQKALKYYLNFLSVTFLLSLCSLISLAPEVGKYLKANNSETFLSNKQNQELLIKYNVLSNFNNPYSSYLYRSIDEDIDVSLPNYEEIMNEKQKLSYKNYNPEYINSLDEKLLSLHLIEKEEIIETKKEVINRILHRDENYIYQLCDNFNNFYKSITKNNENILNASEASREIANNPGLLFNYFEQNTLNNDTFEKHDKLKNYISYVMKERDLNIDKDLILCSLFCAIMISFLIHAYRITNMKTLLFATLYYILFLIISTIFTSVTSGVNHDESFLSMIFFGFIFLPAIFVIKSFIEKNKSTLSEIAFVSLNAGLLSYPLFYLMLNHWRHAVVDVFIIHYIYMIIAFIPLSIIIIKWKALAYK